MNGKEAEQPKSVHEELTGLIRQTAFEIHQYFGPGFLEKVYEESLESRLEKSGLTLQRQVPLAVADEDGSIVGSYTADLLINDLILIEAKAVKLLAAEHQAQILNYLKATGVKVGMLINFGNARLQVKRFTL